MDMGGNTFVIRCRCGGEAGLPDVRCQTRPPRGGSSVTNEALWDIPEPISTRVVRLDYQAAATLRRHGNPAGPRLVLGHGNGLAIDAYYPFWSLLLNDFDVILHDLRNHGWNSRTGLEHHDVPTFIADHNRVLNAIDSIEKIQRTHDDGPGDPPNVGITADMDITATVQTQPGVSGLVAVQDDAALGPWSGIHINDDGVAAMSRGDVIRITNATIDRRVQFGFNNEAQLTDVTFETVSTGGEFLGYKSVSTDATADPSVAEAHEGLLLRCDDVEITTADAGFGEWEFASRNADGSLQASARADDASSAVGDFNQTISEGDKFEFFQGVWLYAFNRHRLNPESTEEDGLATDTEEEGVPGSFALRQNYPNPFNPVTTISYQIGSLSKVKLEVFDLLGRRVATLINTNQATGSYEVTFDGRDLASGLYLYRLEAGSQVQVKKMMLIK